MRQLKIEGHSLSEVLIGLFLSSLIAACAFNYYLKTKSNYFYWIERLMHKQEQILVASFFRTEIRKSGFSPCRNLSNIQVYDTAKNSTIDVGKLIRLSNDNDLPNIIVKYSKPNSHVLSIKAMDFKYNQVLSNVDAYTIKVSKDYILKPSDKILIADCFHAEINQVRNIKLNSSHQLVSMYYPLIHDFNDKTYIGSFFQSYLYIRKNPNNEWALYYKTNVSEEISSNINMLFARQEDYEQGRLLNIFLKNKTKKNQRISIRII
jgi:hypothetical protein